ncbi:MAG TPA: DUF3379 family protein [Gammaproteobacteria bacterium]
MNCEEFEQRAWAEPNCDEPEFVRHMQQCTDCGPAAAELRAFDWQIGASLRVDCPEGLVERIRARHAILSADAPAAGPFARLRELLFDRPAWVGAYAAFATVLLVVGVLRGGLQDGAPQLLPLEQLVAEHTLEESFATRVSMPVPRGEIESLFAQFGARLVADLGGVTFANGCVMENGIKGAHLVLDTPQGKVTVLVIPHRPVDGARTLRFAGHEGRIVPYGRGSLAVIGDGGGALGPVEQRFRSAVQWL